MTEVVRTHVIPDTVLPVTRRVRSDVVVTETRVDQTRVIPDTVTLIVRQVQSDVIVTEKEATVVTDHL